jgi:hypothetical protein
MALVGDLIISARELMTDLPPTVPPPTILAPPILVPGSGFPAGTFFFVVTQLNPWGESAPSNEVSVTLSAPSNLNLSLSFNGGATAMRAYIGFSAGGETFYMQYPAGTLIQLLTAPSVTQPPPTRSTAYLPDSDGGSVGVFAIYRWLNQSLAWAAAKNRGGLPDFGAAATTGGQPNYTLPGYWKKIDAAWYDGFPLGLLQKNNVFRRNPVTGYSGMLTVFQATDRLMVEAWPQPSRTSARTTLAFGIGATDSTALLTSTANFVLGFGMAQIGSEIVNYAGTSGNNLIGLQRGMTGTVAVAHVAGEPVTELNLMVSGYRVPSSTSYFPGQAATPLYLPPGWDEALVNYLLYRFRKAEQDEQGAAANLKEAEGKLSSLGANRIIAGPRQIQPYNSIGPETVRGMGGAFGGVLLP